MGAENEGRREESEVIGAMNRLTKRSCNTSEPLHQSHDNNTMNYESIIINKQEARVRIPFVTCCISLLSWLVIYIYYLTW